MTHILSIWMELARGLAYDKSFDPQLRSLDRILHEKLAICHDIALAFDDLLSTSGFHTEVITGKWEYDDGIEYHTVCLVETRGKWLAIEVFPIQIRQVLGPEDSRLDIVRRIFDTRGFPIKLWKKPKDFPKLDQFPYVTRMMFEEFVVPLQFEKFDVIGEEPTRIIKARRPDQAGQAGQPGSRAGKPACQRVILHRPSSITALETLIDIAPDDWEVWVSFSDDNIPVESENDIIVGFSKSGLTTLELGRKFGISVILVNLHAPEDVVDEKIDEYCHDHVRVGDRKLLVNDEYYMKWFSTIFLSPYEKVTFLPKIRIRQRSHVEILIETCRLASLASRPGSPPG